MLENLFVVSWSHKQKTLHIEQLDAMLKTNLDAFIRKYPVDFIPLAFTNDFDAANKMRIELEAMG